MKFIYWFAYYNLDSSSVRYRAKHPLEYFDEKYGVKYFLVMPNYSIRGFGLFAKAYLSALFFRKKGSLIVIQRLRTNFIYANLLKFLVFVRNKNTVYDLDDADYLEYEAQTIYYFAKKCCKISSGSLKILEHLKFFNSCIFHTTSPVVDLGIVKKKKNELFTIGWVGGFHWGHKKSLYNQFFLALKTIEFKVKLVLIGVVNEEDRRFVRACFKQNNNIEIYMPKLVNWNDEQEIQHHITLFDIGIATLENTEIQLSKSGFKAKQYLNNGIPVLSTNLAENNRYVIDGFNGFLCNDNEEFRLKIIEFYYMDNPTYMRFSENARNSIHNFDHEKFYQTFLKISIEK